MTDQTRHFAIVTGASGGIGLELAKLAASDNHDLLIAADQPLEAAAAELRALGATVETLQVDLSTVEGVDQLFAKAQSIGRPIGGLFANAGHGLGKAFLDQDWNDIMGVVNTNITGTIRLLYLVAADMKARGEGKILITGSIAGLMPGHLSGGLQRDEGVRGLVLLRPAARTQGQRRDGHLPDARARWTPTSSSAPT